MFEISNIPRDNVNTAHTPPPPSYILCGVQSADKLTATLAMCRGTDSLGYDKKLACELNLIARNLDHVY
jgi:hypothetical protein